MHQPSPKDEQHIAVGEQVNAQKNGKKTIPGDPYAYASLCNRCTTTLGCAKCTTKPGPAGNINHNGNINNEVCSIMHKQLKQSRKRERPTATH
jgi:hypothetical protein